VWGGGGDDTWILYGRVTDPDHLNADPYPDPASHQSGANLRSPFCRSFEPHVSIVSVKVADTYPLDSYDFWPPGSGSVSTSYGSGSGFFYHQEKILRKTLIHTVLLLLYDFLSLKNVVNVDSKSNKQKFLVAIMNVTDANSRVRIRIR
jgi:hypothetical protein